MQVFVGLGNPGEKYCTTRHNLGFIVLDLLATKLQLNWSNDKGAQSLIAKNETFILVKPQTFMNRSGIAVKEVMKKTSYASLAAKTIPSLFLIYDDLDLEVGHYKIVFGSSPKMHNGVNSVKESLGTDQFWHLRIGVDSRKGDRSIPPEDYVLSGFTEQEQEMLSSMIDAISTLLIDQATTKLV